MTGATLTELEAFFRRSGLPHLVEDARMSTTKAAWRASVAVWIALAAACVAASIAGVWGVPVLAGLAVPVLGVIVSYVLIDLGALALFVHQGRPALEGLGATASVAVRALPPLLAVLLFLSLSAETWRAFGRLEGWRYGSVLIVFGVLAAVILVAGLRRERHALYAPEPGPALERAARETPAARLVDAGVVPRAPALERLERVNVAVALLVSLGLRVLVVGLAVSGAFIVLGMLIVDRALTAEWVGQSPHVLLSLRVSGREVILSEALVRVATTLGAFASLYFSAVALGEARNREEFLDDEIARVGRVMAAWSYYRGALTPPPAPPAADG